MKDELNDDLIVRYLLGGNSSADVELCEDDTQRIEEQYFTDPTFRERMLAIEDNLIHEYANGELSPEDRKQFENQPCFQNPETMERVRFYQGLNGWAVKSKRT